MTSLDLLAANSFAHNLELLLAQRSVLPLCSAHLDLQPVDFFADAVDLSVETVLTLDVSRATQQ